MSKDNKLFSSLTDDLKAARRRSQCCVAKVIASLDKEDADALKVALDDPNYIGTSIARILRENGYVVNDRGLQRHRANQCGCGDS